MKISELKAGQGKVDIEVKVTAKGDVRSFDKYGKQLRVCNATVSDGESEMTLSLWNDEVDVVEVGAKLQISNGYVSEFQGKKQLSAGKFGKLSVVEGDSSSAPAKPSKGKAKPAPAEEEMAF
jgi:ssDNA-binding replication factor A large subunit